MSAKRGATIKFKFIAFDDVRYGCDLLKFELDSKGKVIKHNFDAKISGSLKSWENGVKKLNGKHVDDEEEEKTVSFNLTETDLEVNPFDMYEPIDLTSNMFDDSLLMNDNFHFNYLE